MSPEKSNLVKAFEGLKQEPETPGTWDLVSFVNAGQRAQAAVDKLTGPRLAPPPAGDLLRSLAKSQNPDYAAVKIFLRKKTHTAARRKWEDAEGGDFSDLVEQLLRKYLGTQA